MSLLIDAPFSSVTTYRNDYTKKSGVRRPSIIYEPDYSNPLTGPLEEHVLPYFKYERLPENQTRYPHPGEYANLSMDAETILAIRQKPKCGGKTRLVDSAFNTALELGSEREPAAKKKFQRSKMKVADRYPTTRTFLKDPPGGPPDLAVIDRLYANENKTIYMLSYCRLGYDSAGKKEKSAGILPEGWVVPLTTHKCSYREPSVLSPGGFAKINISRPKNNLAFNEKEREVLEIRTGESTYMAEISNVGDGIIKGKLHGDVNVRPKFDQDELLKAKLIRTR